MLWRFILLSGLSMSIGWGVRGQFGGEDGAAVAGALGAMAVVLFSGRQDWWRRIAYFAAFGAIGWAFGGGMSYMKAIAYGHSPDSMTVLWGFGCIFLLGFVWAAPGGGGTALPAYLTRQQLTEFFIPISALIAVGLVREMLMDAFRSSIRGAWWTEWLWLTPIVTVLVIMLIRRRIDMGGELILYLYIGRWLGGLLLVRWLGIHLFPPRGDGWAGMLGLIAGLLLFCWRKKLGGVAFTTIGAGFLGGIGFALGELLKIVNISTGLQTNWHSVMEQTQGLFHGIALAIVMWFIVKRAPTVNDVPPVRKWTDVFAVLFVLWGVTYVNFRHSPGEWVKYIHTMPARMYGIWVEAGLRPSRGFIGWFDIAYLAIGIALAWILVLAMKRGLPLLPANWLGRGQLLYLAFLWAVVIINFVEVIVRFEPIRLVTEFAITINAAVCTVLAVAGAFAQPARQPVTAIEPGYAPLMRRIAAVGVLGAIVVTVSGWATKRALFGDTTVPYSTTQIRFGPNNTNDKH